MMRPEYFIGRVTNVKDPEKAGRIQIRIYGLHDDTTMITDDDLPWAKCIFPVTNPVHQGMASPTTGIVVNSTVIGLFIDHDRQVPLVTGTLGSTSSSDNTAGSTASTDFPKADAGTDHNDVLKKALPSIGVSEAKYLADRTIGSIAYTGQEIDSLLHQIGAGNIIGAIHTGIDVVRQFENLKNNLVNSTIGNINSMIHGFVSDIGANIEQEVDSVLNATGAGHIINLTQSLESWKLSINPIQAIESAVNSPLTDTIKSSRWKPSHQNV
jgi:hypothetical protein